MDLIDLIIGLGSFAASFVLIVLLLVQGAGLLASLLDEHDTTTLID